MPIDAALNNAEAFGSCEIFELEGLQQPQEIEEDYGFYEDLDEEYYYFPETLPEEELAEPPHPRIEDAQQGSLESCPPILPPSVVESIVEDGLPWSMQDMKWDRLFSSARDGNVFGTFMRKIRGRGHTVLVAKASDGRILGAFANDPWCGRKSAESHNKHAFLFSVPPPKKGTITPLTCPSSHSSFGTFIPGLDQLGSSPTSSLDFDLANKLNISPKRDSARVDIFKAKPGAAFKQVCQLGNKFISLGDGHSTLLTIENSLTRGTATTAKAHGEHFDIVSFEVYGFSEE